jgi:hypothetical protein
MKVIRKTTEDIKRGKLKTQKAQTRRDLSSTHGWRLPNE